MRMPMSSVELVNAQMRKRRTSSIGCSTESSTTTKIAIARAPTAKRPSTRYEVHPQLDPSERARRSAKRLLQIVAKPRASRRWPPPERKCGSTTSAATRPRMPIGTLM